MSNPIDDIFPHYREAKDALRLRIIEEFDEDTWQKISHGLEIGGWYHAESAALRLSDSDKWAKIARLIYELNPNYTAKRLRELKEEES